MNDIDGWVNEYIGIPYKTGGVDTKGADCLGIIELIYKEKLNIHLPFNEHLETEGNLKEVGEAISVEKVKWIKLDKPENFCVVVLNICGFPVHLGLVLNNNYMIHSLKGHNSVVEKFDGAKWKNRTEGFYRHKDLD